MIKHIHSDVDFSAFIAKNSGLAVVDFFATWCGPCQQIAPHYENLSSKYPTVSFAKVDVDKCPAAAASQGVSAMPTFLFYVDASKVDSVRGANVVEVETKIKKWAESVGQRGGAIIGPKPQNQADDMWFNGQVAHAIAKAKHEKSLLIVFVYGKADDKSNLMLAFWQNDEIRAICQKNRCVALKFDGESAEAKQFSEYYPLVCIPISFLIDGKGVPLEILAENLNSDQLKTRLLSALSKFDVTQTQNLPSAENPCSSGSAPDAGNQSVQTLLRQVRDKKELKENEDEKSRELKRRDEGKNIAEARDKQKELEILAAAEEKKKAKKADKEYLAKLKEQIALDRAEKSKVFESSKSLDEETRRKKCEENAKLLLAAEQEKVSRANELCKVAKVQFRLGDGRSFVQNFDSEKNFEEAVKFIDDKLKSNRNFQLIQMCPRREFGQSDYAKNFKELDLVPSAVLMVLEHGKSHGPIQSYRGNWIWSMLTKLSYPILGLYNWLRVFIFPPAANQPVNLPRALPGTSGTPNRTLDGNFGQQDGNVRRMPGQDDDKKQADKKDDDNATWNGNSTQQL